MPLLFTHFIAAWATGHVFQFFTKKKLSHWAWVALLIGGIIPDGDLLIDWIFNLSLHRTYSHSLLFLILIPAVLYLILKKLAPEQNNKQIAGMFALGIAVHICLDMFNHHGVMFLFPAEYFFSFKTGIALKISQTFPNAQTNYPLVFKRLLIDSSLGMLWILYHLLTKKIKITQHR